MQYVWQYRLWPTRAMVTTDGRRIEVLDTGLLNRDAGPDFFNAKVLIGGQEWVGDVEMHVRATDWHRHGHDGDKAYDSVVLHVVDTDDGHVCRTNGEEIPQMVMPCAANFSELYAEMVSNPMRELPCGPELGQIDSLHLHDWITALAYQRLYDKIDRINGYLQRYQGDWTQTIYATLARALGFNTNSQPMELLALSTPLKHMLHYTDSHQSIEAMLFGQAGLLGQCATADPANATYHDMLVQEYAFLSKKYGLQPIPAVMWKMARMRPQNFPHRRIATLAALVADNFAVGRKLLGIGSEEEARRLFDLNLTGYWARHYNFGPETSPSPRALGYSSVSILLINVVVPILYAYGEAVGDYRKSELAIELLQSLKGERNVVTDIFARAGIEARDAFTSQALIQLRRSYCEPRKCIYCRIGHRLLSQKVMRV